MTESGIVELIIASNDALDALNNEYRNSKQTPADLARLFRRHDQWEAERVTLRELIREGRKENGGTPGSTSPAT